ncbi:MAG: hypothetical protein ACE5G5_00705 [Candidatus Methylomirabilales bacterium]
MTEYHPVRPLPTSLENSIEGSNGGDLKGIPSLDLADLAASLEHNRLEIEDTPFVNNAG